jgi:hypothetical protein
MNRGHSPGERDKQSEGRRPSAHQAAEPQDRTEMRSKTLNWAMKTFAFSTIVVSLTCQANVAQTSVNSKQAWPRPIPVRIRDSGNKDLLVMTLGAVNPAIADGTFDPATDEVRLKSGGTLKNYYRDTLKIKYYKPIDKSKFPLPQGSVCFRLCRLMCGRSLTFRRAIETFGGSPQGIQIQGHSPVKTRLASGRSETFRTSDGTAAPALMIRSLIFVAVTLLTSMPVVAQQSGLNVAAFDRVRVLKAANQYLQEAPITITASTSPRSAGGLHDFFSEGDYWWPDPKNPDGPYIQRDGMTNPDNFTDHRRYLMRLSVQLPALAAAWKLTKDSRYARHAALHLRAWFIDERTRMNPNLQYAQAIHGRFTGRGIGIIDTIHLVEVARAIEVLAGSKTLSQIETEEVRQWFADYLEWMTSSKNGLEEREARNNHGTCWVLQVAAFAKLTGNQKLLTYCRDRFKKVLVPSQIAADGSFPQELRRTKPYGYSLFNLDAMATLCQILATPENNLWIFSLPDGRGIRKAMAYMYPYIKDKKTWPLAKDVTYDGEWPMRHNSLLFAGLALGNTEYIGLWKTLKADSSVEEVIRNFFVRQPVLWV